MSTKPTIEELLALRDGDDIDDVRARELEADADARESLAGLRAIRRSLRELPEVQPSDEVWVRVQAAARAKQALSDKPVFAERWLRFPPLAMAASVFFAAVVGMLVWQPFATRNEGGPALVATPVGAPVGIPIGDLVSRSKALERQVGVPVTNAPTSSESALFYRLADIDSELSLLDAQRSESGLSDEDERWRRALWQRRIALLESLRTVQQAEQPEFTYAIY